MKYLALILFCLWVLSRALGAQEPAASFAERFVGAAKDRLAHTVRYDPAYVVLDYPGGDVPADTGVCTDEVIRAYRTLGIDLQKLLHEDMKADFSAYPNLETFFRRHGAAVAEGSEFLPGDLVTWDLNGNGLWHIGMVIAPDTFVHNIGAGPERTTGIRQWKVQGHFRYHPRGDHDRA
jgi:uncharacterized protein YijF (DUF1287 family)